LNDRQLIENKDVKQIHLTLSAATGEAKEKESLYLDFFRAMISGGMSFPLFQELRDKRGLCYNVYAGINKWSDVGKFYIYIGTDPKRYKEAISASFEVIEKSKSDEKLLEKVKNMIIGELTLDYEDTKRIIGIAAHEIAATEEPRGYNQIIQEIKEVDINNIKNVVDKYLKPELIFTTIIAPKNFKYSP
jgi:predicted Zn-dependent peptidase